MSVDQVEAAFEKALKLTQKASTSLPVEYSSPGLLETVFAYLIECEKEKEQKQ